MNPESLILPAVVLALSWAFVTPARLFWHDMRGGK